ncbi:RNA polymerase sigma factor [Flavilitoribacter nigricans]|uniref:RNA polymerase sigma factor n=1 Tax=Flavilitoribacter nigricans (strain ATCC 23147 / DSM 23189 / NBRC 102662 / NCIMB 1420 / SS-2) TaxID=1122177 RepID=A0A2D0MXN9_FLAN2|nr:RNA polymerase sigma factor [Flavilitoribacter nigricans]PHN01041.1 RNA polymerase subunit sigma-70 [Flavilitoribacter nigricans DSM 23189 = NBRC 102662]
MKESRPSLTDIIKACRQGEESAQFALYERYYSYALTVSLHYCRNRDEAEEVVQDAFVKVFRSLEQFDVHQPFKPWLRTITVRTAINHFRAGRKADKILGMEAVQKMPGVENKALNTLAEEEIYRLLQLLPPAYRLVFNLYVLEGYNHPEIAELLGISVGTSKSNLAKARRKLQKWSAPFFRPIRNSYTL